ncbi:D-aminoacyl-tRNA deacylase [Clostridium aminobutyricum]|uniref:D-aminoacyl-tRNA deacylase n=1 Tax=Clostridium aminobutyricum TaxID=33953 RepID=A0A939IID3_CLOAM|nr:D-aminoacyl-tRNA deacylase [Clostridium aminobutyricum]MBN7772438.1 D-tyrosyl-tRNA(Tyr) deacylase [Clostridium aminobutyricum]
MRAVVQRVINADVQVEQEITGAIERGFVVLLGVEEEDDINDVKYMVDKISGLRIFEDEDEKMNLSLQDVGGQVLAVSQFTLLGDVRKGKRPSFTKAARPEKAKGLYDEFVNQMKNKGIPVGEGIFQADMLVRIYNDGPVTILLDSKKLF